MSNSLFPNGAMVADFVLTFEAERGGKMANATSGPIWLPLFVTGVVFKDGSRLDLLTSYNIIEVVSEAMRLAKALAILRELHCPSLARRGMP
jgi:hypothetical protein